MVRAIIILQRPIEQEQFESYKDNLNLLLLLGLIILVHDDDDDQLKELRKEEEEEKEDAAWESSWVE